MSMLAFISAVLEHQISRTRQITISRVGSEPVPTSQPVLCVLTKKTDHDWPYKRVPSVIQFGCSVRLTKPADTLWLALALLGCGDVMLWQPEPPGSCWLERSDWFDEEASIKSF